MKITKNKKWSLLIVLLFFIWGGISYHWYTCNIKGFCSSESIRIEAGGSDGLEINRIN